MRTQFVTVTHRECVCTIRVSVRAGDKRATIAKGGGDRKSVVQEVRFKICKALSEELFCAQWSHLRSW